MLAHLVFVQAVDEADSFVRVNSRKSVRILKDSLLKVVKLISVMRVLVTVAQARLEHEVCLDDPSESVSHFERDEGRDGLARCQKLQALRVRLLLLEEHQF